MRAMARPRSKGSSRKPRKRARARKHRRIKKPARKSALLSRILPSVQTRRRWRSWRKAWRAVPATLRAVFAPALLVLAFLGINGFYQIARKPSELFFPLSDSFYKTPVETWRAYGHLFERHSTETITRELLAALAQVEASGNPVARTYWRWSLRMNPFAVYRPASSAVGMYQITSPTFAEARRYCIHRHTVTEVGPWHDVRSCWFNGLYTRTVPSHAIEMTSAYLDRRVAETLSRLGIREATLAALPRSVCRSRPSLSRNALK